MLADDPEQNNDVLQVFDEQNTSSQVTVIVQVAQNPPHGELPSKIKKETR